MEIYIKYSFLNSLEILFNVFFEYNRIRNTGINQSYLHNIDTVFKNYTNPIKTNIYILAIINDDDLPRENQIRR
jgi:hypothetical protein